MVRRLQPPLLRNIATAFVAVWGLGTGCNPSLLDALGANPITSAITPDGYIIILVMNKSSTSINTQIDITKENGTVTSQTISVAPQFFFNVANDCNVSAIQVVNFGYSTTGGLVTNPSNLGPVLINQGLNCGNVVAITATGSPPTFTVQVY